MKGIWCDCVLDMEMLKMEKKDDVFYVDWRCRACGREVQSKIEPMRPSPKLTVKAYKTLAAGI